jgi:hypothetical protein
MAIEFFMAKLIRIFLGLGAVIVAALLVLNVYVALKPRPKPSIDRPLAQLLPAAPLGWQATDLKLADSPEGEERVVSILHYDDAAFRMYQFGENHVGVYVAYWQAGKFSPAKVGLHTPDTCWIDNGWEMNDREHAVTRTIEGETLKPLEFGIYTRGEARENVVFWHLVGGEPNHYDIHGWENGLAGRLQRLPALFADFAKYGLDQRQEQLIVRISSNLPLDELWKNAEFAGLMKSLSDNFHLATALPKAG